MTEQKLNDQTDEDQNGLSRAWRLLGGEETDSLSVKQLGTILRGFGRNPSEQEVQFLKYDNGLDDHSFLTYEEALVLYRKCTSHAVSTDAMIDAFRTFDANNDGYLTLDALKDIMTHLGEPLTDDEVEDMFREADTNRDGKVVYEEFARIVMAGPSD